MWIYRSVGNAWSVRHQTYGYLPSRRELPVPFGPVLIFSALDVLRQCAIQIHIILHYISIKGMRLSWPDYITR